MLILILMIAIGLIGLFFILKSDYEDRMFIINDANRNKIYIRSKYQRVKRAAEKRFYSVRCVYPEDGNFIIIAQRYKDFYKTRVVINEKRIN